MKPPPSSLISGFLRSAELFPDRAALSVERHSYTYGELLQTASSYAAALDRHAGADEPPLTAIFASRTLTAFAGVLAALLRGHGYVPYNVKHPPDRTRGMLEQTNCRVIVADREWSTQLAGVLGDVKQRLTILLPETEEPAAIREDLPQHTILGARDLAAGTTFSPRIAPPDSIAYIIFTSGSTGVPKGVMVSHANLRPLIDFFVGRYDIREHDRISVVSPLSFDPSTKDIFLAWERGACAFCPSDKALLNPGRFINNSELTIWHCVPSMILFMKRLGALKRDSYPTLRLSMFGGEPLLEEIVAYWKEAAPRSAIENLYGPTELAISCTYYPWNDERSPRECYRGIVPIGYPNPGMTVLVCDENLNEIPPGETGELLMSGPQVSLGYLGDAEKTARAFIRPPGRRELYYRTGDLVRRPNAGEPLLYIGRIDSQLKILGQRIELGEIEAVIREDSGISGVVAVGWPLTGSGAQGIEVFIEARALNVSELKKRIALKLPTYMMPKEFHFIPKLPLDGNGKYDRHALHKILEAENERC
jgi:amino acid adenylation domain-containing protein